MRANIIVLFCAFVAVSKAQGPCSAGWTYSPDTGSCYHLARDPEPWGEALKMCEIHGSKLIHIESQTEQNFIEQLLKSQAGQNNFYWLGGSDWSKQGSWVWEPDGEAITYTNWAPHEPNNGGSDQLVGQDCMVMIVNDGYRWHDYKCDPHNYYYICEKRFIIDRYNEENGMKKPFKSPNFQFCFIKREKTSTRLFWNSHLKMYRSSWHRLNNYLQLCRGS